MIEKLQSCFGTTGAIEAALKIWNREVSAFAGWYFRNLAARMKRNEYLSPAELAHVEVRKNKFGQIAVWRNSKEFYFFELDFAGSQQDEFEVGFACCKFLANCVYDLKLAAHPIKMTYRTSYGIQKIVQTNMKVALAILALSVCNAGHNSDILLDMVDDGELA